MKRRQDVKVLFGRRLRQLRLNAGLSQEELADKAGLDRSYVGGVERGERNISLENICKIAAALESPPERLLDFSSQ
jgi:transcriptional regulator with XRE-family HTH domain